MSFLVGMHPERFIGVNPRGKVLGILGMVRNIRTNTAAHTRLPTNTCTQHTSARPTRHTRMQALTLKTHKDTRSKGATLYQL